MSKMSDCQICISTINKSTRQLISCLSCNQSCCLSCVKEFFKTTSIEPSCMFCSVSLSKYDLVKMKIPKNYLEKEYKKIRGEILFNNDKSHYVESFKYVPEYKKLQQEINETYIEMNKCFDEWSSVSPKDKEITREFIKEYKDLTRVLHIEGGKETIEILDQLKILCEYKPYIDYKIKLDTIDNSRNIITKKSDKMQKLRERILQIQEKVKQEKLSLFCTSNECNGMLNTESKCVSCEKEYCKECNIELSEGHECNKNDVKSFEMIKRQTKSCPKCFVPIHKIQGCDQMFCTGCNTPFSWKTGEIFKTTRFFHNPHYFDHLDNGGENIFNTYNEYTPPITFRELQMRIEGSDKCIDKKESDLRVMRRVYRELLDFIDIKLHNFTEERSKKIERVRFLSNEIDKQSYIQLLMKEDKKRELLYNVDKVYEMFYHKAFKCIVEKSDIIELKIDMDLIINDCMECINNICKDLGSKAKQTLIQPIMNCSFDYKTRCSYCSRCCL